MEFERVAHTLKPSANQWTIRSELKIHYTIKNSPGIFCIGNEDILEFGGLENPRRLVAIDKNICQYYADDIADYMKHYGVDCRVVPINSTEENKNFEALVGLLKEMEQFGVMRRDEPLIAVGGGVLLDIAGMAATLYRRGIPYVRVPTTLVGIVDASVGAKTGINFENRRNRLGSYYPPAASYLDKNFLRTLEPIEISSGLGEILKMAVAKDRRLFEILERHGALLLSSKFIDCQYADEVINRATLGMIEELENNLWERNLQRLVDFGHSFSPIIEMRSIHEKNHVALTHGQAVALDVIFSCIVSNGRSLLSYEDLLRVIRVARNMSLPTFHQLFTEPLLLFEALQDTIKHRNGNQNLPMPKEIGSSFFMNDLTLEEIRVAAGKLKMINLELFGKL